MPRDGAIIFSDLIGKTEVLRVTCEKCGRDRPLNATARSPPTVCRDLYRRWKKVKM
jgi:hypothetical protein